ncbi:MAG: hypothetical protein KAT00_01745 [Planctomycetes bacterium]|nr:hypothetical protein [Planctomycetota bacterium]
MDTLEFIKKLVVIACFDSGDEIDISGQVMRRIRSAKTIKVAPLAFFAGVSAAAACLALFFTIQSWIYMSNPIMEFFMPLQETLLW